ncbi:aminotransferase DegT [Methanothermobacter tenebrarum]|jgi:perosamine synthetase|uniref:Aminotransferase DegT n=1 Tax=Methanothermobacter tenebrarum TaxID=680118 RepID=A0ABM7YEM2_9EURY|nr:DegT/DnrJ/EryC1/StrS aminotransferase family protein [Methanothermobacter tenebrarum]MDI6882044.1 DegT/DnrJ/EryC1/StrS aminotransferase family protein [Methanothermobacter sp.]NLC85890.1 DegT/DnrJ/EryC1/StrS aminotransferase family protein [Bacteroidales bacterium]MDX9692853.1 DegT/DnrJ/EryC1/StrS aminotransferase family protein [Methanothermobacter sp.]BDH79963.1 aminotransferase DegT [Methanothermobacter tenebrarum]HOQ19760.1 DegT/DnrJ/EryC1/StrS aminotransferase family protein [Methanoth
MIPVLEPSIGEKEIENVLKAVKSGWVSSKGKFVEEFERKFAEYHGVNFGVSTSNGTTALHLALESLGIGKGDEVLVPVLTFAATANAVLYCNAKPVFVDSHPDYWCIDPEKIEERITKNTKAIIPVHLYGHPCDMAWIQDIAEENDLYVIEDAAEAHGAEYRSEKVGTFGDISCFSFYGNKIITTGEGGMCLTDDEDLAEKMIILRDHGMKPGKRYWHDVVGFNYRMTNIQAALGVAQLSKLDKFIEKKREIASVYHDNLNDLAEDNKITLHPEMPWAKCVFWAYSIILEDTDSEVFREKLSRRGIDTRAFFYPLNVMPPYKTGGNFPVADRLSSNGLNLPSGVEISEDTILFICERIREVLK